MLRSGRDVTSVDNKESAKNSPLQTRINENKYPAVIGLEYIIEVHFSSNFECVYHCVLCEGKFDLPTVVGHLTAVNHRLNYLKNHFPTAYKELSKLAPLDQRELKTRLTEKVCEVIVHEFGRLSLLTVKNSEFMKDRMQIMEKAINSKHIDEHMGSTYVDIIRDVMSKEQVYSDFSDFEEEELKSGRASLDSISTSCQSYRSPSVITLSSSSNSLHLSVSANKASSKEKSLSKKENFKMQMFRQQMDEAEKELTRKYDGYKKKPLTHENYKNEWNTFWRSRYKELKAANRPTDTHNYKQEWEHEWKRLMDEQLRSEIDSKALEIKQNVGILNVPADNKSGTSSKKSQKEQTKDEKSVSRKESSSKKISKRPSSIMSQSPSGSRRSHGKSHSSKTNRQTRRSRSPQRSLSPRSSRSPRRLRRFPSRCCSPKRSLRSRSPKRPLRSRSPKRPLRSRSPKRSLISRSPKRSRRSPLPQRSRRSRSPLRSRRSRSNQRSHSHSPSNALRKLRSARKSITPTKSHAIPTYQATVKPKPLAERISTAFFPWTMKNQASMSPELKHAISPSMQQQKIFKRRYTTYFPTTASLESKKVKIVEPLSNGSKQGFGDEPLTIISILSLLTALEDILGSLGPKVIGLMHQAKTMDKAEANSSNHLLDNDEHYILFETIKEKLKGLIGASLVEANKQNAVKKAIRGMTILVDQTNERNKACKRLDEVGNKKSVRPSGEQQETPRKEEPKAQKETYSPQANSSRPPQKKTASFPASEEERKVIKVKLSAALLDQGRTDITEEQMEFLVETYLKEVDEKKKQSLEAERKKLLEEEDEKRKSIEREKKKLLEEAKRKSMKKYENVEREVEEVFSRALVKKVNVENKKQMASINVVASSREQPVASSSARPVAFSINRPTPTPLFPVLSTFDKSNKPTNLPQICPPPITKDEAVTLSDSDLLILKRKFEALSQNEQENYLCFMKKLQLEDPARYKLLNDEKEPKIDIPLPIEKNIQAVKPLRSDKFKTVSTEKRSSDQVSRPASILPDMGASKTLNVIVHSDSDSDDSDILAKSIANSQQQIAKVSRDLNPIEEGMRIPVIDSVQTSQPTYPTQIETLTSVPVHLQQQVFQPRQQHPVFMPHQQQSIFPPHRQQQFFPSHQAIYAPYFHQYTHNRPDAPSHDSGAPNLYNQIYQPGYYPRF